MSNDLILENNLQFENKEDVEMELQRYKHKKSKHIIHNFLKEDYNAINCTSRQ